MDTPQQIVAENGGVVWKAQYAAFGKAEVSSESSVTNNLRFPGQYYDEETGLHYNWNRYYDVESGRYSQVDPIGFEGGDINLYQYARSNSVIYADRYGLLTDEEKIYIRNRIEGRPCPKIQLYYPQKNFKERMFCSITKCNSREDYNEKNKNFREFVIPEIRRGLCLVKCTVSASVGFSVEDVSKNFFDKLGDIAVEEAKKSNIESKTVRFGRGTLSVLKFYRMFCKLLQRRQKMKFIKVSIIFLLMISLFSRSKVLHASDFKYVGPNCNYKYSYYYLNNEHAFDILGDFLSDHYINKKILDGNSLIYLLYVKNNSVMINGDFEETLIARDKTWIQGIETYSIEDGRSISKYICNKYYRCIGNKNEVLFIVKEGKNIVEEEVYLKNFGLLLHGGYSKDFERNLNDYAFVSNIDGESISGTYIYDIKECIFDTLKEYDINRSTQQNIPD